MQMLVGGKILKIESVLRRGSCSPGLKSCYYYPELLVIFNVNPKEKYLALEPGT
jgi:hypothetical protein